MTPSPYSSDAYVSRYPVLYVNDPFWAPRRLMNARVLESTFRLDLPTPLRWLDLCCGPASHFEHAPGDCAIVGVDASAAQLTLAKRDYPRGHFIQADVRALDTASLGTFSLVSVFWGAYSYLQDESAIGHFLRVMTCLTAARGVILLEVIEPALLESFNQTRFAVRHGCSVRVVDPSTSRWTYEDPGGAHHLCSPPLSHFEAALERLGFRVELLGTSQTLHQVRARRAMEPGLTPGFPTRADL